MQFREQGKKIQLISYRGYVNKAEAEKLGCKPGAQVKFIGTIDPLTFIVTMATDKATGKPFELTDKESSEVDAYISQKKAVRLSESYAQTMNVALICMRDSAQALQDGKTFEIRPVYEPEKLWTAVVALEKALIAAGHPRPKRQYKRKPSVDTATQPLPGMNAE